MKRAIVATICLSQAAWAQSPPPPPVSAFSIGKPHACLQDYPVDAIIADEQGTTRIGFRITTGGTVIDIHVLQSSGSKSLDDAAVICASSWRYRPAMQNGEPVEVPWMAQVKWVLHFPPTDPAVDEALKNCVQAAPAPNLVRRDAITELAVILSNGAAKDVRIKQSSGDAELDERAVSCAKSITFETYYQVRLTTVRWGEILKSSD
jgi:protein TonB